MKKLICLVLSLSLLLPLISAAYASTSSQDEVYESSKLTIVETGSRALNTEDTVLLLMEKAGYSYDEAIEFCNRLSARNSITTEERYIIFDAGAGYLIEVGCLVEVVYSMGHSNFGEILEKWSVASGSGDYTWNSFYVYAEVGPPADTTIHFMSRGSLEVAVTTSSGVALEEAGFSISGTIGTTTYYRKTISIDETWSTSYGT